jgi:hypothetical protein
VQICQFAQHHFTQPEESLYCSMKHSYIPAAFTKVYARQQGTPITPSEFAVSTSDPDQGYIQ